MYHSKEISEFLYLKKFEPVYCKKQQKSSWPVTVLWNRGPLKILHGIKLILDDQKNHLDSYTISLESFSSFSGPLFRKLVKVSNFFCCFSQQPGSSLNFLKWFSLEWILVKSFQNWIVNPPTACNFIPRSSFIFFSKINKLSATFIWD